MSATNITPAKFDQAVLESTGPVLIDFWAPWCGPCRAMGPVVDEVATELGEKANVVKANVDELTEAAAKFGVQSIPAFFVVRDGEVKERLTGVVSKQRLIEALEPHLN